MQHANVERDLYRLFDSNSNRIGLIDRMRDMQHAIIFEEYQRCIL